jgi:uncharacterized RDD family membrane protein YckC
MSTTEEQRFAPPQSHVADVTPDVPALAGRGVRLAAAVVDGLIAGGAAVAVAMIPGVMAFFDANNITTDPGFWTFSLSGLLVNVPLFLIIQGWPLVTRGQTLAKMLFKLRIVRTDGSPVDPVRMLGVRYGIGMLTGVYTGLAMLYGLIDSLLIFRESRQCLHDTLADTKVIQL